MTLTPREIQEKQFHDAFRGYSHEEVDLFIDEVAEAYDQIYRENQSLKRRIDELEQSTDGRPPPEFIPAPVTVQSSSAPAPAGTAESEDMLKRVLMTAQESADKAVQNARARAQALIEEAEAKARMVEEQTEAMRATTLEDSQRRASETLAMAAREEAELRDRIEGLRTYERDFRNRLAAFIKSQLEVLETKPAVSSGMPSLSGSMSAGFIERKRFEPAAPAPEPASQWLSLSDKPLGLDRPARREAPPAPAAPPASGAAKPQAKAPEPAAEKESQPVKSKSKVENKSIRELFWGDD